MAKIIVTGGGTGGHIFPALSIATELRDRGFEILYVGSSRGLEARLVPAQGFPVFYVRSGAIKNQGILSILKTILNLKLGFLWSLWFLLKQRPVAVVGVGGYVSVPVCFAAVFLRIPLFLQEQNVSVGIANRVLGKFAKKVFIGFQQAASYFPKGRALLTGNPVRKEFSDPSFPKLDPKANHILVMGGSQGAKALNTTISDLLPVISKTLPELSILHQTGQADRETVEARYREDFSGEYSVVPFIENMAAAYAKASLVICRSGALTVSELVSVGRPAVFVPYPRRGQNDQTDNANFVANEGAAKVVEQGENFRERLWASLQAVFKPDVLLQMGNRYSRLRQGRAAVTIADEIVRCTKTPGKST